MVNGKIILLKSQGVNNIISDASLQFLRKLTPEDVNEWWLPTEQLVALSNVEKVHDGNGRQWVQNQTLLVPIHDYIKLTKPHELLGKHFEPSLKEQPEEYEPLQVEE